MIEILSGDCRETLRSMPNESVQCCVTSPPYWGLRDYGHNGQLGMEKTPEDFVDNLVDVFREVRRVLKDDGTLWLNLGDSYASTTKGSGGPSDLQGTNAGSRYASRRFVLPSGLKPKDLVGIPWRVALALQTDGWYLRQDIIWHKPRQMPESVTDRCTKAHEYIFLMAKSDRYYYDQEAIKEPSKESGVLRNKRSVWAVMPAVFKGAHFATFPEDLITPCVRAGSKRGDTVLDPFAGSGTTGKVAIENGREAVLCELNPEYIEMIEERVETTIGFGF